MLTPINHADPFCIFATTAGLPTLDQQKQHQDDAAVYWRQRRTVEIIQLEEISAPPPQRRRPTSVPSSSSASSSSSDDEEQSCSSYCSSDLPQDQIDSTIQPTPLRRSTIPEMSRSDSSFNARMHRIEAWRDSYAKAVGAQLAPSPVRMKRKGENNDEYEDNDDDTRSRSSKRSRRTSTTSGTSLSIHSCSACDASFATRQSLLRHGRGVRTKEACRAAVEYGFE